MPVRGLLVVLLRWSGVLGAGVLAVVGGLGLRGPGLVAIGVAAMLAACTAVGITRDAPGHDSRTVFEAAVQAAAWTVGLLLTLAGIAVLAGGLVALAVVAVVAIAWLLTRATRSREWLTGRSRSSGRPPGVADADVLRLPVPPPGEGRAAAARPASGSVSGLTTPELGREWLRTTAALRGPLTPAERSQLVRRREETLDELERRDPAGFARWLSHGAVPGGDPADYVRGVPVQEDPTAGTDAA